MVSEKKLPRVSSLGSSAQTPIPIRQSDGSSSLSSTTKDIVTPPQSPHQSPQSEAASRKLVADDGRHLGLLKSTTLPNAQVRNILKRSDSCPAKANQRFTSSPTATRNQMASANIQRWDGLTRTVSDWDGLRRVSGSLVVIGSLLSAP